jgi:drug/metabolite transporter (DMT)-like permease
MPITRNVPLLCWVLLILLGVVWGGSFLGVEMALDTFSPIEIVAGRIVIGTLVLSIIMIATGERLPSFQLQKRRIWVHCFGMAIFTNVLPFSLLSWAQIQVSSSFAGISMTMVPLVVLPLAHVFLPDERLTSEKIFGFLIGFIGVLLLLGVKDFFVELSSAKSFLPKLACILATVCYAIGAIITRSSPPVSKLSFSTSGLLLASLIILPFAAFSFDFSNKISYQSLVGLLYLGLLPTGLATFVLVYLIQTAGPSFLSLVNYQVPCWAVFFGVFFNNEVLPNEFLIALGLIIAGLFISQKTRKI